MLANERERITRAVVEHADHMETYTLPALQPGFIDGWTHALRLLRRDADSIASRAAITLRLTCASSATSFCSIARP